MTVDLSAYQVANGETSSSTKFDNLVTALQASLNAIGDTTKMAWAAGKILAPSQLTQDAATSGQVLAWNGTIWAPAATAGGKLDYVQITSSVSITATSEGTANTVITGTSQAYDGTQNKIEFWCNDVSRGTSSIAVVLLRGATVLGSILVQTASASAPIKIEFYDTPAASTFSYIVKAFVDAGTGNVRAGVGGAGAYFPAFLRVTKA